MSETRLAWHFVGNALRDGQPVPKDGEWLEHSGKMVMCASGLHASTRPIDALSYAPGNTLCRVRLGGKIIRATDKMVATRRRIVWRINAELLLAAFARWCALQVVPSWNAPDVVVRYLRTGDENIKDAARAAAEASWAARAAARDATEAFWDAARAAARAAAEASWAARAAARDAARAATEASWAARAAEASWAARAAARDAAWDAAWAAARAAARDATEAFWDAAMDTQNKQLYKMIMEARKGKTSWVFKEQADE